MSVRISTRLVSSILALAVVFAAAMCLAQDPSRLVIATADPWPPYADPAHPENGLTLEILSAAFARHGYAVQMVFLPWARAEMRIERGAADILIDCWQTEARTRKYLFSSPFAVNKLVFIKRRGDPFEFTGLSSLKGKVIGTVRGYGYSDTFLQDVTFAKAEANDFKENVRKLIAERVDLIIEDELVARTQLEQLPQDIASQATFLSPPFTRNNLYIAASRNNPRGVMLIELFNAGFAELQRDGTYERILARYAAPDSAVPAQ